MKTKLTRISQLSHIAVGIQTVPALGLNEHEPHVQDAIRRQISQAQKKNEALNRDDHGT